MTQSQQLANRLREVILNGALIANTNFKDQLENTNHDVATHQLQSLNTISMLAHHVHYYIAGIKNVFVNGDLVIRDKYSFDFPPITSEKDWTNFQNTFYKDTEELATFIEQLTDQQLNDHFVDEKYGDYLKNINGLIEHSYYHLGQVVLLNKLKNNS